MEDTSMINSVGDVDFICIFYRKGAFPKIIIIIAITIQRHFPVISVSANSEMGIGICQIIPCLFRNLITVGILSYSKMKTIISFYVLHLIWSDSFNVLIQPGKIVQVILSVIFNMMTFRLGSSLMKSKPA